MLSSSLASVGVSNCGEYSVSRAKRCASPVDDMPNVARTG